MGHKDHKDTPRALLDRGAHPRRRTQRKRENGRRVLPRASGIEDTYGLAHSMDAPVLVWRASGPALPVLSAGALAAEASTGLSGNYGWPDRARNEELPSERSLKTPSPDPVIPCAARRPYRTHAGHRRFVTLGHGYIRFWPNVFTPTDSCAAVLRAGRSVPTPRPVLPTQSPSASHPLAFEGERTGGGVAERMGCRTGGIAAAKVILYFGTCPCLPVQESERHL